MSLKPTPLNARFVAETYAHTHTAIRQVRGYYRYLNRQTPDAYTQDFCEAIRLIVQAESKLAKTLTHLETQEAA